MRLPLATALAGATLLIGCVAGEDTTGYRGVPADMAASPAYGPYQTHPLLPGGQVWLAPPHGVVSMGGLPYGHGALPSTADPTPRANPAPDDEPGRERGAQLYARFCVPCHGVIGRGDGPVVDPFPRPPDLLAAEARELEDVHVYHFITWGRHRMPAYGAQLEPLDRWRVVHHVRRLQAENPQEAP